jgi:hypothetical protein
MNALDRVFQLVYPFFVFFEKDRSVVGIERSGDDLECVMRELICIQVGPVGPFE